MKCNICKSEMTEDPTAFDVSLLNCGGDCCTCMALIAHDPECLGMLKLSIRNRLSIKIHDLLDEELKILPFEDRAEVRQIMNDEFRFWGR